MNLVRSFERHPTFASGVGGGVIDLDGRGQGVGADQQQVEGVFGAVVETHVDQGGGPDVLVVQSVHRGAIGHENNVGDFRGGADGEALGFGGEFLDFDSGFKHVGVLVDVGGEEEELAVLDLEFAGGFVDAAFAEEEDLAGVGEGVADGLPFF